MTDDPLEDEPSLVEQRERDRRERIKQIVTDIRKRLHENDAA